MNENIAVVWNLTGRCNQGCKFCFRKKGSDNSLAQNKAIVDELSKLSVEMLSLSGGEALLYDDVFCLVDYIKIQMPNVKLVLNTNCKNIDDNILNMVISKFDSITLPIESVDSIYNAKIGRCGNHIENVLKVIDFCNGKIEIKINTVIMKNNIDQIDKIYNIIKKYNIKRWKLFRFLPVRDAKLYTGEFEISDEISRKVERKIDALNNERGIEISYNSGKNYKTKYFIYPDGTVENSRLGRISGFIYR